MVKWDFPWWNHEMYPLRFLLSSYDGLNILFCMLQRFNASLHTQRFKMVNCLENVDFHEKSCSLYLFRIFLQLWSYVFVLLFTENIKIIILVPTVLVETLNREKLVNGDLLHCIQFLVHLLSNYYVFFHVQIIDKRCLKNFIKCSKCFWLEIKECLQWW